MSQPKYNDDEKINISKSGSIMLIDSKLTNNLLKTIREKLQLEGIKLNTETIIKCLRYVMEIVEASELKGEDQKIMVIKIMRDLVNETKLDDNTKKMLLSFVDQDVIDNVIDFVVDATKGKVNINKIKDVTRSCCFGF